MIKTFKHLIFTALFLLIFTTTTWATKQFLIIANGEWDAELAKKHSTDRIVLALDGSATKCHEASIVPHYILGDFDSIFEDSKLGEQNYFNVNDAMAHFKELPLPPDEQVKFEVYSTTITSTSGEEKPLQYVRTSSQNFTDLDKGIQYCLSLSKNEGEPVDIKIVGALGGKRIDHFLGNFSVLKKHRDFGTIIRFVDSLQTIQCLSPEDNEVSFKGPIGGKVGIFGFPSAIVYSSGLKWELDESFPLEIGERESSCNELSTSDLKVRVKEGIALLMTPTVNE